MVTVGVLHFVRADLFVPMMPYALAPWALELVWLSGVFEILGGIGLLIPSLRRFSAWGVAALLVAVFPANLHMAVYHVTPADRDIPAWVLWARLPLQPALIALAVWFRADPPPARD